MASKFYQMMRRDYIHCDIVIYNTLINIFGRTDKIQQALEFFEMMKKEGIHPNERTYNIPTYSTPYLTIFYPLAWWSPSCSQSLFSFHLFTFITKSHLGITSKTEPGKYCCKN